MLKKPFFFKDVITQLYNKYLWLKYIEIIDYTSNGIKIKTNKTIKDNGLKNNSIIKVIEKE